MSELGPEVLGSQPIGTLLIRQAIPASIWILVMSLNILIDSVFVGNWIGTTAIAAINVVLPVSFFIGAIGMAVGIGGSSIVSRALGAGDTERALHTFGNQIGLTLLICTLMVVLGLGFAEQLIPAFGGKGAIYEPAKIYYQIVLYGVPFLGLCMMGNTVIRAEGKPKVAMVAMIIPSVTNLISDYLFIYVFDWGMHGAAWATTLGYLFCFLFVAYHFFTRSSLQPALKHFVFRADLLREMGSLGFVTLSRQATTSINYLLLNTLLFTLGGEALVAVYAIIGRTLMFALFPVFGVTQGFLPIAGYNYGAHSYARVKESIVKAIGFAALVATLVFALLFAFPTEIAQWFLSDRPDLSAEEQAINAVVLEKVPTAMRWVFGATPIIALQLIGAAYFQAIGKVRPALLLTLLRQGILFIPLLFLFASLYGEIGVWQSFFVADVLATVITGYFLFKEVQKTLLNR